MNKMYALNKFKLTFTLQLGAERLCICINFSKQLVKPPKMVTDNSTFYVAATRNNAVAAK